VDVDASEGPILFSRSRAPGSNNSCCSSFFVPHPLGANRPTFVFTNMASKARLRDSFAERDREFEDDAGACEIPGVSGDTHIVWQVLRVCPFDGPLTVHGCACVLWDVCMSPDSAAGARPVAAGRGAASSDDMGSVYRPQVNESGNEVSCSVDETNKLRASLGLKPLRVRVPVLCCWLG
jgi:hypothetical protein